SLVSDQQLRWYRTSLLGRIPGWSPLAPIVGPWRTVWLDAQPFALSDVRLVSKLEGEEGTVTLRAHVHSTLPPLAVLKVGDHEAAVEAHSDADGWIIRATLRLPRARLWWPHTHGEQPLYSCSLCFHIGTEHFDVPCGPVGFRRLQVKQDAAFSVHVN